ncbi:MAG: MFS transporter [Clostridia bacterium]|nr:MFS transporter [Clostridia bacterium]
MKEKVKLSNNAKVIILDNIIGNIIEIFLTTFLAAYFYKVTQDNLIYLSGYYIIAWIVATIGAFIVGDYIKRKNKVKLYRFGICLKALFIFLIIILKERIIDYFWIIGICYGLSVSATGFPFNMMESELVMEKERAKYQGYKSSIGEIVSIIIPIFLGAYITATSYHMAAILVFIFSFIKIIISFFIKNLNVSNNRVNIKGFIKEIKKHKEYPIFKLYIIEFLKGITVNGVLSIIISLLIVYEFNTELNLGIWNSIFSICMIITMLLFAKFYNKKNPQAILRICSLTIAFSCIWMLISINKTTIILYNFVYYIFIRILRAITEINLFDYSNKPPFNTEFNTEYFTIREVFINAGRVFGYIVLLLVGFTHNMECLKYLFICTTIALILIVFITKKVLNYKEGMCETSI